MPPTPSASSSFAQSRAAAGLSPIERRTLNAREVRVLSGRTGMYTPGDWDTSSARPRTRAEVARRLAISVERCAYIEKTAIAALGLDPDSENLDRAESRERVAVALSAVAAVSGRDRLFW